MKFGYGRVSTKQQNIDRQIDLFNDLEIPKENIYIEKISGTIKNRQELNRLKETLREGDEVFIESYSRLGRSIKNLIEEIEWFNDKGIRLVSNKENFDTKSSSGKLMLNIMLSFSQFERDLIVERTMEGKRSRGRYGGRPRKSQKEIDFVQKLYDSKDYSIREICQMGNMSEKTLRKYIKSDNDKKNEKIDYIDKKISKNQTPRKETKWEKKKKECLERYKDLNNG